MLYDLTFEACCIGQIEVNYSGLYCVATCRCRLPGVEKYRLFVRCNEAVLDLGLLVPEAENTGTLYRFPVKKKEGNRLFFYAEKEKNLAPVSEDLPFPYVSELYGSILVKDKRGLRLQIRP